jgi:hypothetical protein
MIELPRKAKGQRPVYLEDRTIDNMLSMFLALAGEVVVLRERLDTAERLLDESGKLKTAMDNYRPTEDAIVEREAWRAQFIDLVMRPIQQEYEGLEERADSNPYTKAVDLVTEQD